MSCQRVLQVEKSCFGVSAETGQHFILSGEQHQATHTGNKARPTRLLSKKPQTLLVFLSINNLQYLQAVTLPWVSAQGGAGGALSACPPFAYGFFFVLFVSKYWVLLGHTSPLTRTGSNTTKIKCFTVCF